MFISMPKRFYTKLNLKKKFEETERLNFAQRKQKNKKQRHL